MGRTYAGSNRKIKAYLGSKKVKSMWYGSIRVYPNAGEVTYYVDNEVVYTEEIDIDQSCLTPTTFTPSKSGWTFVGWREDSTASSSVLSEKISDGNNYTLYAVFRQNVTVTKYNGSSSATTETKTRYYNNTNVANPSFTLSQNNLSGWTAQGWCTSNSATAAVAVNNGATITLTANATYYGKYSRTITLSYNGNGATGGSTAAQTGTRYYNSGNYSNPSFTLRSNGFSRTNGTFTDWAIGSVNGTKYSVGAKVTLSSNETFYAKWTIRSSSTRNGQFGGWHQDSHGIDGNKTEHVVFSPPFDSAPTITTRIGWGGHSTDKCSAGSRNVTASSADIYFSIWETGSTNYGYTVYWTATGTVTTYA